MSRPEFLRTMQTIRARLDRLRSLAETPEQRAAIDELIRRHEAITAGEEETH
jgi:hypothetical protein